MTAHNTREFLGIYLNDHLAGASGGVELARRVAHALRGSPGGDQLGQLANDIAADRAALLSIMRSLGIPARQYKSVAGWAAEKAARLKLNGRLLSRSPLSDLVELDGLLLAVQAKAAGWRTLLAIPGHEIADQLNELISRADAQVILLEQLRLAAAGQLFGHSNRTASGSAAPQ
ncbi:MAG TPA: hypothetical protein VFQ44_30810 [Streptosporangiaceae bacterium]|nr:hypothetical protein [Streptosporangiaceae bacterium]